MRLATIAASGFVSSTRRLNRNSSLKQFGAAAAAALVFSQRLRRVCARRRRRKLRVLRPTVRRRRDRFALFAPASLCLPLSLPRRDSLNSLLLLCLSPARRGQLVSAKHTDSLQAAAAAVAASRVRRRTHSAARLCALCPALTNYRRRGRTVARFCPSVRSLAFDSPPTPTARNQRVYFCAAAGNNIRLRCCCCDAAAQN